MKDYSSNELAYMDMVQGVINRLASTSATFKGFAVTLFAGVLAVVFGIGGEGRAPVLTLACAANLVIAGFDCWYFAMEKRYRKKFELIRRGDCSIDFEMKDDKSIVVSAREVLKSKAIWLYYLLITLGYIASIGLILLGFL